MEYLIFSKLTKKTYNVNLNKNSKMSHNRDLPKISKIYKIFLFVHSVKMLNPSLKDLDLSSEELKEVAKLLAKKRGV